MIDYGLYAGWKARDLIDGKGTAPSPFPSGMPPDGWDWQNFLNYGGDADAAHAVYPEPEQPEPVLGKLKPLKRKLPPKHPKK